MLVLSRGRNDKVLFPQLDISVQVLDIAGSKVRLGIEAPPQVAVLRHELADSYVPREEGGGSPTKLSPELRHQLNATTRALHLSQRQLHAGRHNEAEATLEKALREFGSLEKHLQRQQAANRGGKPQRRALLVEHNANESELLAGYLRISGFEVQTAPDGGTALELLAQQEAPDAVLLAMCRPRCDGAQTLSAIRSNPRWAGLKVFAVGGTSPAKLGVETGPAGINRWFPKPINPETLVRELSRELSMSI
jgi:carbon storage regulator CsrA